MCTGMYFIVISAKNSVILIEFIGLLKTINWGENGSRQKLNFYYDFLVLKKFFLKTFALFHFQAE